MCAFVKALVRQEFELGRIFLPHPCRRRSVADRRCWCCSALMHSILILARASGFTNTVACRRSGRHAHFGDRNRMTWPVSSSCTSPRARISDRTWRTCSPTRRMRTEGVSVVFMGFPLPFWGERRGEGESLQTRTGACVNTAPLPPSPPKGRGGSNYSVRSRSSTSKVSSMSPFLMSVVASSVTPHSRPARTSATSSLKRRRLEIEPL
jgi:hypothetical protein